jgi:HK97 family phage major capsid protein
MGDKTKLETGTTKIGPRYRFVNLLAAQQADAELVTVDTETRTATFSFSSETACQMSFGEGIVADEVLSHQPGAARLARIVTAGPLLFNHDKNDLLGVVEKAWIGPDRRGYCTVRFGSDARGDWAMKQYEDRILKNVSFFYRVYQYRELADGSFLALSWEPYEISLVTIPADISVGQGRSAANEEMDVEIHALQSTPADADNNEGNEMFKRKHIKQDAVDATRTAGGSGIIVVDAAAIEQARVTEIDAMCRQHQIAEDVRNHMVNLKAPIEMARGIVLNTVLARSNGAAALSGDNNPDLTEREKAKYSLVRAINAAMKERMGETSAWKSAGFEREVSQEIAKKSGKETAGLFMPTNLRFYAGRSADYSVGTGAGLSATSGGSNLVATQLLAGSFIELLRNKARVLSLGAQMLSGLVGNVDIPRQKSAGATYWIGEGGSLPQAGAQFDKISLTPKHIGAISIITRNMLQQSTPDIEMMVRADMLATIALGVDSAVLYGSGSAFQPLGIANQAGIGSIVGGANGSALTLDDLIDLETFVMNSNADENSLAYLTNAKAVGTLKKLKSSTGQYLWTNSPQGQRSGTPGEINGYTVARTNQARSNLTKGTGVNLSEVFFGDWSQVVVGEWGVVEILPNPYAAGIYEQGGVELRVLQSLDVGCRHPQAFATKSDAITG